MHFNTKIKKAAYAAFNLKLFFYAVFAVKLVVHFVEGCNFFGVKQNLLQHARALVGACTLFVNIFNHFVVFALTHTLSLPKNYGIYTILRGQFLRTSVSAVNFFKNMFGVGAGNVNTGNGFYAAEKSV